MRKKALKLTPFDAAEYLQGPQEIRWFLEESIKLAAEEDGGNFEPVRHALETAVRAYGASKLARVTGISRDGLYKAFAKGASPKFDTVAKVLKVLGVDLFGAYARQAAKAKPRQREREQTAA